MADDNDDALKALNETFKTRQGLRDDFIADKVLQAEVNKIYADRAKLVEEIMLKEVGFSSEQRRQSRFLKESIKDEIELFGEAEKYFGVEKGKTAELEKQARLYSAINRMADVTGISATQRERILARANADLKSGEGAAKANKYYNAAKTAYNVGDAAINYQLQNAMIAAIGKSTTLMQGSNYTGRYGGQALSNNLFGGTGTATSPVERMEAMNKVLMAAPKAANETSASMDKMIGTMAFFGADMGKITDTFIKGSREAGLGAEDIARVYNFSNLSAKELGLSTQETADTLLNMSTVFRQVGGGVLQASGVMKAFSGNVEALGVNLLGVEKIQLMTKFTQGISSLPFDKMVGLAAYATGKSVSSISEKDIGEGNMLGIAIKVFQKISRGVNGQFVDQGVATQKTAEMLGMQLNGQQTVALEKLLKGDVTATSKDAFNAMANPAEAAKGLAQLTDTIEPIQRMANATQAIQAMLSTWGASVTGIYGLLTTIAAFKWGAGVVSALGTAAVTVAKVAPEVGAEAVGAAEAGGALLGGISVAPALIVGAGLFSLEKHRRSFEVTR